MTWWLYLPLLAYAIPLPSQAVCEQVRDSLRAEGHTAACQTVRPAVAAGTLPPDVETDLKRLVERGGT